MRYADKLGVIASRVRNYSAHLLLYQKLLFLESCYAAIFLIYSQTYQHRHFSIAPLRGSMSSSVGNDRAWLLFRCGRHRELVELETANDSIEQQHATPLVAKSGCHLM